MNLFFKSIYLIVSTLTILLCVNCKDNNDNKLKTWLEDEKKIQSFYSLNSNEKCEKLIELSEKIQTDYFKNQLYYDLAVCFLNINHTQSKKDLLKSVSTGLNPSRIDAVIFEHIFNNRLKKELMESHKNYWSAIDTSYLTELDRRIDLDKKIRFKAMANPSNEIHEKMIEIDRNNQEYLLHLCKNNGYPSAFYPSHFSRFRPITPSVIVSHSPDSLKLVFLNFALNGVEQEKVSWREPIAISNSLFVSGISQKEVHPLWLTYFNKNKHLDIEKSYLQLYSIKKLYNQDMIKVIKIHPSKFNKSSRKLIYSQLKEIKNKLIQEFSFDPDYLIISNEPDNRELDYRGIAPYSFTLSVID